jgi:hypothetical protein
MHSNVKNKKIESILQQYIHYSATEGPQNLFWDPLITYKGKGEI